MFLYYLRSKGSRDKYHMQDCEEDLVWCPFCKTWGSGDCMTNGGDYVTSTDGEEVILLRCDYCAAESISQPLKSWDGVYLQQFKCPKSELPPIDVKRIESDVFSYLGEQDECGNDIPYRFNIKGFIPYKFQLMKINYVVPEGLALLVPQREFTEEEKLDLLRGNISLRQECTVRDCNGVVPELEDEHFALALPVNSFNGDNVEYFSNTGIDSFYRLYEFEDANRKIRRIGCWYD